MPRPLCSYLCTLTNGALLNDLMLNGSAGTITGTPTQAASNLMLTFQVADSGKLKQTKSVTLTLTIAAGNSAGNAVQFTVPTIANGKMYVPARGGDSTQGSGTPLGPIDVYGLIPN